MMKSMMSPSGKVIFSEAYVKNFVQGGGLLGVGGIPACLAGHMNMTNQQYKGICTVSGSQLV